MSFEIEIKCECGQEVDTSILKDGCIEVTPCKYCIKEAKEEGYKDGYKDSESQA